MVKAYRELAAETHIRGCEAGLVGPWPTPASATRRPRSSTHS